MLMNIKFSVTDPFNLKIKNRPITNMWKDFFHFAVNVSEVSHTNSRRNSRSCSARGFYEFFESREGKAKYTRAFLLRYLSEVIYYIRERETWLTWRIRLIFFSRLYYSMYTSLYVYHFATCLFTFVFHFLFFFFFFFLIFVRAQDRGLFRLQTVQYCTFYLAIVRA